MYLTNQRLDMLPTLISGDICSLHGTITYYYYCYYYDPPPVAVISGL